MTPAQQEHYELCLAEGCSETLAEMLALAEPPGAMTDAVFLQGMGGCYDQFRGNAYLGDEYGRMAKRDGVDATGKVYLSGLAAYPGDPRAWIAGRGDVRRVCEERGWGCEGAVSVPVANVAQPERTFHVAEDLVEDRVAAVLEQMPAQEAACVDTEDLREQVVERLRPVWAK